MINEIKEIVRNYIYNAKLCCVMIGIVNSNGITVDEKLTIPNELIKGNLKTFTSPGDRVCFIRNHGGKEFYIIEILNNKLVTKGANITLSMNGQTNEYKVEEINYDS